MEIRPLQTRLDCCWSISAAFDNFPFERPQYQGLSQLLPQVSLPLNFQHFRRLSSRIVMISRSAAHAVSRNVATFQRHAVSHLKKLQKTDPDHDFSHFYQSNLSMCCYVNMFLFKIQACLIWSGWCLPNADAAAGDMSIGNLAASPSSLSPTLTQRAITSQGKMGTLFLSCLMCYDRVDGLI